MRWENEGGAVSAATDGHERSCSRVEGETIGKESASQAADGRQAVGDGAARGRPGASLGQRKILPFELLA
jgi:hypothetical protein